MQTCVDWVLITFGTQVIHKKRLVRPVFPDYLSVSYDYGSTDITDKVFEYIIENTYITFLQHRGSRDFHER